jgi:hypothetical protein
MEYSVHPGCERIDKSLEAAYDFALTTPTEARYQPEVLFFESSIRCLPFHL